MAGIQDALLALQSQKTPFESLLEGVAGGVSTAQDKALENAKMMMALEERRQEQAQQAEMQRQIKTQMEAQTASGLKAIGGTPAVLPTQKMKQTFSQDEKGKYSRKFEVVEPKDTSFQAKDYQDAQGKSRIGSFDPATGKLKQSPDDPYAPKPASEFNVGEKHAQYTQKRLTALGDALDPSKQRQGSFGVSKQVFDRAERLQSLASAFPDGNLDSRQMEEIAIGLNAMLSGSNTGAQAQVASLVPKTVMGNAQKLREWLSNDPKGTNQQAFVQRMMGSVEREKQTAADQIKRTQLQRTQRYSDLEKSSPDEFYNMLQSAGIEPDEYKKWKASGFKPMSAVQKPGEGPGASGAGTQPVLAQGEVLRKSGERMAVFNAATKAFVRWAP
jgi:hypothetical protein